ncbi:MAG TPA: efflux RND transporter periplasmic adaptor subunit [Oscillatoriales cyanobacterium M59_W2019_021]|nr:MAG: efflux RND transporter periplasmic adaptor subunit [Cyanobacteria bacterium J055]HIK33274.1 efflux RND transporter periplasmic adaptor subunit [Oscillatoriales cyanobacterium M4454_W2019_049]HIK52319.1 efflux RND transporter periplasmic adaptor subunit [Oscillatoriales cyanobacterium M59_W2019_021]
MSELHSTEPQSAELQESVETLDAPLARHGDDRSDWEVPPPPPPNRFAGWRNLFIGLGIGFAIAFVGARANSPANKADSPATPQTAAAAQTVTTATVEAASVDRTLDVTGTVYANDLLPILPKAPGLQIVEVLVDEGDYVEAGQVLAVLDDSVLQTQIDRAQSQVTSATAGVAQAEAGVEQARSTRQELEAAIAQAEAGILQAQAERTAAQAGVEQARAAVQQAEAGVEQAKAGVEQARAGVEQAQANVERAEAGLEQAQREFDRYRNLANSGAISQQELDFRQTDVLTAREDVRVARANLAAAYTAVSNAEAQVTNAEAGVANAEAGVTNARSQVDNATSREDNARANLDSARAKLNSQDANIRASQANVDSARAGVQGERASVAQIETQLEQTLVRAPQSGIVATRMARVGDVTSNSGKLFEIIRDAQLELRAQVPETQLPQVQPGDAVRISSDADPGIRSRGTVREIAPTIDPQTRIATVKIDLPDDEALRPGMFLKATITTNSVSGLTIPAAAVLPQPDGGAIVYKLGADNVAIAQTVEVGEVTGQADGDLTNAKVEVKSGLELGDRIVLKGAGYVKEGDRVNVSNK